APSTAQCANGRCLVKLATVPFVKCTTVACGETYYTSDLDVDATNVYWTNPFEGTVVTVPLAGGAAHVLASGQSLVSGLAVDATTVYWATTISIMSLPRAGGSPITLYSSGGERHELAVDATS